jgi:hypothetical protein
VRNPGWLPQKTQLGSFRGCTLISSAVDGKMSLCSRSAGEARPVAKSMVLTACEAAIPFRLTTAGSIISVASM